MGSTLNDCSRKGPTRAIDPMRSSRRSKTTPDSRHSAAWHPVVRTTAFEKIDLNSDRQSSTGSIPWRTTGLDKAGRSIRDGPLVESQIAGGGGAARFGPCSSGASGKDASPQSSRRLNGAGGQPFDEGNLSPIQAAQRGSTTSPSDQRRTPPPNQTADHAMTPKASRSTIDGGHGLSIPGSPRFQCNK